MLGIIINFVNVQWIFFLICVNDIYRIHFQCFDLSVLWFSLKVVLHCKI